MYHVRDIHGQLICVISKQAFDGLEEKEIGTWIPFNGKNGKMSMVYKIHTSTLWRSEHLGIYFWNDYVVAAEEV